MTDDEARGEAAALAMEIDAMVVRPEPVDWQKVNALAQDLVRVATEIARSNDEPQGRPPA